VFLVITEPLPESAGALETFKKSLTTRKIVIYISACDIPVIGITSIAIMIGDLEDEVK